MARLVYLRYLWGADFGAGMLEMFAVGESGARQEALIDESIGPVWESNHVWLIFLLVVFFSAFPPAFAAINVVLYIPLILAVIGIVLRGSAFIFKTDGIISRNRNVKILGRTFSVASAMTPFFLALAEIFRQRGLIAGALTAAFGLLGLFLISLHHPSQCDSRKLSQPPGDTGVFAGWRCDRLDCCFTFALVSFLCFQAEESYCRCDAESCY